jgi:transposase
LKKYVIKLTPEERSALTVLTSRGKANVRRVKRALVLLAANDGERDEEIAGTVRVGVRSVERIRQRFVEEGLEAALSERPRPGKARLLSNRQEALLIAITCSTPPPGRAQWTMQLLADRLVELKEVERISDETVRRTLKKGSSSPGNARNGASRP